MIVTKVGLAVLLVLVMLGSVVSPALAATIDNKTEKYCNNCKVDNQLIKKAKLVLNKNGLKIYKSEYNGKTYLLKITESKTKDGRIVGKVQIAIVPDKLKVKVQNVKPNVNVESIQALFSWEDIIKRYEVFLDTLDECGDSGKYHHYAGVTFELGGAAGAIEDAVLSWAICTLIGTLITKYPTLTGLACAVVVALILYYYPTEKTFTVGAWDYDFWIFHMSADGVGKGWHTPVSKMIPIQTYPFHRLTW